MQTVQTVQTEYFLFLFLHLLLTRMCFGSGHKLVFNYTAVSTKVVPQKCKSVRDNVD